MGDGGHPSSIGELLSAAANLTTMQRRILVVLSDGPRGTDAIEDALLEAGHEKVKGSTLYRNLDTLDHHDLVDIEEYGIDGRSHEYRITDRGRRLLEADRNWSERWLNDGGERR